MQTRRFFRKCKQLGFKYIDNLIFPALSKATIIAPLYYVIKGDFSREQKAFFAGKGKYYATLKTPNDRMALLRRNVHRLEKGILMKPRRVPFGLDYIEETVRALISLAESNKLTDDSRWFLDVLAEYFEIHAEISQLQKLRVEFEKNIGGFSIRNGSCRLVPYIREDGKDIPRYSQLLELARYRRSVRWFENREVPRSEIDKALKIAALSPSACNRQPFVYKIFDDRSLVEKIVSIPGGLKGYGHNVPCVAVIVGQQRNYNEEKDRHLIYIDSALSCMSFVYALETLGLSSCCVNWPDVEMQELAMEKLLELEDDERPIMLVVFGYPDMTGLVAASSKKSLRHLRNYNFEG